MTILKNLCLCAILPLIFAVLGYYLGTLFELQEADTFGAVGLPNYPGSILKFSPVVSIFRF